MTSPRALTAALAGLAISCAAHGQAVPQTPAARATAAQADPASPAAFGRQDESYMGVPRFSLDFPGGTIGEYVDMVKDVEGVVANISLSPDTRGIPMPPIQLSNVSVSVALRAVESVTDASGAQILSTRTIESADSATLYSIQSRPAPVPKPQESILHPFRVASLLDQNQGGGLSEGALLGAIETLLSLDAQAHTPPRVMLHKETSTLIMQGNASQLRAVETLLEGLERDSKERRAVVGNDPAIRDAVRGKLRLLDAKLALTADKLDLAEREISTTQQLIKAGALPESAMLASRGRLSGLEEERLELEMDRSLAEAELQQLETSSAAARSSTLRIKPDRADITRDAARVICEAMSPRVTVEMNADGLIKFTGTERQLAAVEQWLRLQGSLAE